MKLEKILEFNGTLTVKTGVHIGCSTDSGKIGGCDNPVIKDSLTGIPYIPASSIKGKMRCNMEQIKGLTDVCKCGSDSCMICTLFGSFSKTAKPGRLIISDLLINQEFLKTFIESGRSLRDLTEIKTETAIDRNTSKAANGALRNFERIVPGVVFDVKFTLKIYDTDNEKAMIKSLQEAVKGLNALGIGAKTASGSGQVDINIDWKNPENILA